MMFSFQINVAQRLCLLCKPLGLSVLLCSFLLGTGTVPSRAETIGAVTQINNKMMSDTSTGASSWPFLELMGSPGFDQKKDFLSPAKRRDLLASEKQVSIDPATWRLAASMQVARYGHTATTLQSAQVLVVGGIGVATRVSRTELYDPETGEWRTVGPLHVGRAHHTATLLPSGKVLVVGGATEDDVEASAELYDPETGEWERTESLSQKRQRHTATLLPTGEVLVVGGEAAEETVTDQVELYDPTKGQWRITRPLHTATSFHTATLLQTGKVMVVSGIGAAGRTHRVESFDPEFEEWTVLESLEDPRTDHTATLLPSGEVLVTGGRELTHAWATSELYDPITGFWETVSPMATVRTSHSATLLPSGNVLVVNGKSLTVDIANAEVYDPEADTWTNAGRLSGGYASHAATLLSSGEILVTGGTRLGTEFSRRAEVLDPSSGSWQSARSLNEDRDWHTLTLLNPGKALVVGGRELDYTAKGSSEIYRHETGDWAEVEDLVEPRYVHTATRLLSGKVLVTGGLRGLPNSPTFIRSAEIFDPATEAWQPTGNLQGARAFHAATLLPSGKVMITGGRDETGSLTSVEVYDPEAESFEFINSLKTGRFFHSATLLHSGKVLVVGGQAVGEGPLVDVEAYDPETERWESLPGLADARLFHTATLLPSGNVLVAGGAAVNLSLPTVEMFDPELEQWTTLESMNSKRQRHSAVVLTSGHVFVAGGFTDSSHTEAAPVSEIFDIKTRSWSVAPSPSFLGRGGQAVMISSDEILTAGGAHPGSLETSEVYGLESPSPSRRPRIESVDFIEFGVPFTIEGDFRGDSEASGGTTDGSAMNYPIVSLRSLDGARHYRLLPDPLSGENANFWDEPSAITVSRLPAGLNPGPHLLSVSVAGVASDPVVLGIDCSIDVSTPTAIPSGPILLGETVTLHVATQGVRRWQWLEDGTVIDGETHPTYTISSVNENNAGRAYQVQVENDCTQTVSGSLTLPIPDNEAPEVEVIDPSGGEYWRLSEEGGPPDVETVTWEMSDNIRICQVDVDLVFSNDGGQSYEVAVGTTFGSGGSCTHEQRVEVTNLQYNVPTDWPSGVQGSIYKVRIEAFDQAGVSTIAESQNPFYIERADVENVKTLILSDVPRMGRQMGISTEEAASLDISLRDLANHPRVQGLVVDLAGVSELQDLFAAWDGERANAGRANQVLFGCHEPFPLECLSEERDGLHDHLLSLLEIYSGVESIVIVGDDRIVPMARIADLTVLYPESNYTDPLRDDLTATGTSVGEALDSNHYLSDDPLAVLDRIHSADLNGSLFIPDLAIGRLVETPAEITTTIASFISSGGVLDLSLLDAETGHKFQVTGYDFLADSAKKIWQRWQRALGDVPNPDDLEPVDGQLVGQNWDEDALGAHLCGNGGASYGLVSLNGHATHYLEGVPGNDTLDIQGLSASEMIDPSFCGSSALDFSGSVIFAVGCHGGLPVPGSNPDDPDNSLDLPQAFLSRGAVAYIANSGYGWGSTVGVGYSELLMEIFSVEMSQGGGIVRVGDAVLNAKERYYLESKRTPDPYDVKTLMQWTYFGLPMYAVETGIAAAPEALPFQGEPPSLDELPAVEFMGPVQVNRRFHRGDSAQNPNPAYLTKLEINFDLTAAGIYKKFNALGHDVSDQPGCPMLGPDDPDGCYYTLNSIADSRSTGVSDLPIQPYLVYDSRLSGTSQHGVLWLGGEYEPEGDWRPVVAKLVSNGGDNPDLEVAPRMRHSLPNASRWLPGQNPPGCRSTDREVNSIVLTTGEVLKYSTLDDYIQRTYRRSDIEVFYFNNSDDPGQNCDRTPPKLTPGFGDEYHEVEATTLHWAVAAEDPRPGPEPGDPEEVWRVVVVYDEVGLEPSAHRWTPLELTKDGGIWRGSLDVLEATSLTYIIQAVDRRGNVRALEYESEELPPSGVELQEARTFDVEFALEMVNLGASLVDSSDPVQAGHSLTYDVFVENLASTTASQVTATIELPSEITLDFLGDDGWSCDGQEVVVCELLEHLPSGEVAPKIGLATVAPESTGTFQTCVTVEAIQEDTEPENNTSCETTEVIELADLSLTLDDGQTVAIPGEVVTYTVTLAHVGGPAQVTSVELTSELSSKLAEVDWQPLPGHEYDGEVWSGFALNAGESVTMTVVGTLELSAVGQLISTVSVATHEGIHDLEPINNSDDDVDEIADIQAPAVEHVHSVSSSGGGQLRIGESTSAALTQLYLTFSEPVTSAAAEQSSYLLVSAGEDGLLQTTSCAAGSQGDDGAQDISVSFDETLAILELNDGTPLPRGEYRLLACSAILDLAGNELVESPHDFAVLVEHLLLNVNFDQDLEHWQISIPASASIQHDLEDADLAPTSGSALVTGLSGSEPAALWQCITWNEGGRLTFGGRVKITGGAEFEPVAVARTDIFETTDCSGAPVASSTTQAVEGDTLGSWRSWSSSQTPDLTSARSILMSFVVQPEGESGFEVRFDDLYLSWGTMFTDDFESGDLSRWLTNQAN